MSTPPFSRGSWVGRYPSGSNSERFWLEAHELFGVTRAGLFFFAMAGVEDGLRRLTGDAARQGQVVERELAGPQAAKNDPSQRLVFDPDRRQQQRRTFEAKAGARLERLFVVEVAYEALPMLPLHRREEAFAGRQIFLLPRGQWQVDRTAQLDAVGELRLQHRHSPIRQRGPA